ncbi:hypothetical protein AA106555_1446 [Neokomagataea thailandica NBRC 106555]|uniref:Phosphate ABC transporter substrate-binding protein n=2 Tax=Neokomagataea TaxID=1223423 RepID=A0A4Y6V888_9PROT|nr:MULTISPECIES: hypothetical protein [Neokomagataea]QDH24697.1 hypothetical protein D5366_05025 [Neokomagataea tanensis]GBR53807.1 hypothetical protein AA106555_1446 [Neokomagataea thailandica NBRC 106555]
MYKYFLTLAIVMGCTSLGHAASSEKTTPIPALTAHYNDNQGSLIIGGSPESEDVASAFGLTARVTGPLASIPLLTHGIIAAAILPRDLTDGERAAIKRYTGGTPLILPLLHGLYVCVRRNSAGAIDRNIAPFLLDIYSESGQKKLNYVFDYLKPLSDKDVKSNIDLITGNPQYTPIINKNDIKNINIVGSDTLEFLLPDLEKRYQFHGHKVLFSNDLRGSSLAIPALIAGTSAFAPMGREAWKDDINAFLQAKGYAPTRIRIAYASYGPRADGKTPPAVYVNQANPLVGLAWPTAQKIFSASYPLTAAPTWGGLGITQEKWIKAPIHVYGLNPDNSFASAMQQSKLNGLPFSPFYRAMPNGKAVLNAIAHDPYGIGYSTWIDGGKAPEGVKLLPLSTKPGAPYALPDGTSDRTQWPISYFFNIYVDCPPSKHLAPEIKNFLLYLLSAQGQKIISDHKQEENGYLPLGKDDLKKEVSLVDSL